MGNQFVAVGDSLIIHTSPNGLTWTSRHATGGGFLFAAATGSSRTVVVGFGASMSSDTIFTSADGVSWEPRQAGVNILNDIIWTGSQFMAVGGNRFCESSDGLTWTSEEVGTGFLLTGVAKESGGSRVVVVGSDGTIRSRE